MFLNESSHPAKILDFLGFRGASPALTWYTNKEAGERIELSGKVCLNHISKIANYLNLECALETDGKIYFDLPVCWKSLLWANATLLLGAKPYFLPSAHYFTQLHSKDKSSCTNTDLIKRDTVNHTAGNPSSESLIRNLSAQEKNTIKALFAEENILITDNPHFWSELEVTELESADLSQSEIIALNTASFAFAWNGELPSGVIDGQAEVMGQPDALAVPISTTEIIFTKPREAAFGAKSKAEETPEKLKILAADHEHKRVAVQGKDTEYLLSILLSAWSAGYAVLIYQGGADKDTLKAEGFSPSE